MVAEMRGRTAEATVMCAVSTNVHSMIKNPKQRWQSSIFFVFSKASQELRVTKRLTWERPFKE
jgi:hypothetical protein